MKLTKKLADHLYTVRWYMSGTLGAYEKNQDVDRNDLDEMVREATLELYKFNHELQVAPPENPSSEPDRPDRRDEGQPDVSDVIVFDKLTKPMKHVGKRPANEPRGLLVHHDAGRTTSATMNWGAGKGYHFLGLDEAGKLYAPSNFDWSKYGWHAGKSSWPGIHPSKDLIGVEVRSWGKLTRKTSGYWSWANAKVDKSKVRSVATEQNIVGGYYEMFTEEQEARLIELCLQLKKKFPNSFDFDYVLGHDEVAGLSTRPGYGPGKGISSQRKNDPGGCLSMSMPEFREHLKGLV